MEELAFDYIRKIESYGKALVSGFSTHQASEFITRSHVAMETPRLLSQNDKMFRIEGTKLYLGFMQTLFGLRLCGVYESEQVAEGDERIIWHPFDTPFTEDQPWSSMILPVILLGKDEGHIIDPAQIAELKESIAQNYGQDAASPSIEIICYTLGQLLLRDNFRNGRLCLVNCRYVVSSLYGHPLMRPREVSL